MNPPRCLTVPKEQETSAVSQRREPGPCHGAAAGHVCEGELHIQSEFPGHYGIEETPKSRHHQDLLAWLSGGSR